MVLNEKNWSESLTLSTVNPHAWHDPLPEMWVLEIFPSVAQASIPWLTSFLHEASNLFH